MTTEAVAVPRARTVPAWLWLTGIVALSVMLRYGLGRRMVAPWIMVDELTYSELAKSFAATGHFAVREVANNGLGFVYPLLIAPAFRIGSIPDAYAVAKTIDAVLMSLAAVPAYLLARRVVGTTSSLLVAAMTLAVPSMVYTGTLMTENAFYPLFLWVAFALVIALEHPTWWNQTLLLGLCGAGYVTRAQAIALVPAVLTAPVLYERGRVHVYRWLYGLAGAGGAAVLLLQLVRGRSLGSLLGDYRAATDSNYGVGTVFRWLVYHVAELDLYVGIAPFAALLFLAFTARGLWSSERAFVAAAVALTGWLVLEVAAFASEISLRIEERNMFYVAPLFFIALALWIERGLPRPTSAAVAVVIAVALPGAIPFSMLLNGNAVSDTLALLPLIAFRSWGVPSDQIASLVVLGAAAIGALVLLVPRRATLALPAAVLVLYALALPLIESSAVYGIQHASVGALYGGIASPNRDWVDRAVGSDANVAFVWSGAKDKSALWENEFFNRSVRAVYDLGERAPGGLPSTKVSVDGRNGVLRGAGRAQYVLTDEGVRLDGAVVARDPVIGMVLYRVDGPLRVAEAVRGVYADGWSGPVVRYTRYDCEGGSVTAAVQSDGKLFRRTQVVSAKGGKTSVLPGGRAELTVPLRVENGVCSTTFEISPAAVPASRVHSSDTRVLGVHFVRFVYHA